MLYCARMTTAQKTEIKKAVSAALREIFSDPDYGLELKPSFKRKLKKSMESAKKGHVRDLKEFLASKK